VRSIRALKVSWEPGGIGEEANVAERWERAKGANEEN
jgi:hypothetical protein